MFCRGRTVTFFASESTFTTALANGAPAVPRVSQRPGYPSNVRFRRPLQAASSLAVLLVLVACGEDGERGGGAETGASGAEQERAAPTGKLVARVAVAESEYRLIPPNPEVEEAGVVQFDVRNAGKIGHAVEVEGPEGEVETEEIEPGGTATLKADLGKPGRYIWYCPIADHEQRGMKGEILVAGGGLK